MNRDQASAGAEPERLQDEIALTRAELDRTVSELQSRLSPEAVGQQVRRYVSDGGADGRAFMADLTDTVRRYPLPFALLGVGVAWLMIARRRSQAPGQAEAGLRRSSEASAVEQQVAEEPRYTGPRADESQLRREPQPARAAPVHGRTARAHADWSGIDRAAQAAREEVLSDIHARARHLAEREGLDYGASAPPR